MPRRIGPYLLLDELARGGMGVVYRARDTRLDRFVALKAVLGGLAAQPQARKRFEREAEALARVQHPHVLRIHGCESTPTGELFMVMELLEGESLQRRLDRTGPMSPGAAVELALVLCDAVEACHAVGVLHRDLKPDNVFVDGEGRLTLIDFGLARDAEPSTSRSRLSVAGQFLGSPGFWAPEQAAGEIDAIDVRTDVYGLGATLFALLTGRSPLEATSLVEALRQARATKARASTLQPSVPGWLDEVVARALATRPAERYGSAHELAVALRAGAVPGAGHRRRRTRGLMLAGAALALAAAGAWAIASTRAHHRWGALLQQAREEADAVEASLGESPADMRNLWALEQALSDSGPPGAEAALEQVALRALIRAIEADRSVRLGQLEASAEALRACEPPSDAPRSERRRVEAHLDAARTGLYLADRLTDAEVDTGALRRGLAEARQRWPRRADLTDYAVRLAIRLGRTGEAEQVLNTVATPPADLVLRVALARDHVPRIQEALEAQGLTARVEAQGRLRLATLLTVDQSARALEAVRRAQGLGLQGLEAECARLRAVVLEELGPRVAPRRRLDLHEILDLLDPSYTLSVEEILWFDLAAMDGSLADEPPGTAHGGATERALERLIGIAPDSPRLLTTYTRHAWADPDVNVELFRRALTVTDYASPVVSFFAKALARLGRESELRDLIADYEARGGGIPAGGGLPLSALAELVGRRALGLGRGSERTAALAEAWELWARVNAQSPDDPDVQVRALELYERVSEELALPGMAAARSMAKRFLVRALELNGHPAAPSSNLVERIAAHYMDWTPRDELDDALYLVDEVISVYPLQLWLTLRRLEVGLARGEDIQALLAQLDLPERLRRRQAHRSRAQTAEAGHALVTVAGQWPRLEQQLERGETREALELTRALHEALPTGRLRLGDADAY